LFVRAVRARDRCCLRRWGWLLEEMLVFRGPCLVALGSKRNR
jgi:hypothetical protein